MDWYPIKAKIAIRKRKLNENRSEPLRNIGKPAFNSSSRNPMKLTIQERPINRRKTPKNRFKILFFFAIMLAPFYMVTELVSREKYFPVTVIREIFLIYWIIRN
jgi:hypothetical protein